MTPIVLDDLYVDRAAQRFLADTLAEAHRRRLGTWRDGQFTPSPGQEHRAAEIIEAALVHPALAVADTLGAWRRTTDPADPVSAASNTSTERTRP